MPLKIPEVSEEDKVPIVHEVADVFIVPVPGLLVLVS